MKIAVTAIGPSTDDLVKAGFGRVIFSPDNRERYIGREKIEEQ
jgi:hypothetical protein